MSNESPNAEGVAEESPEVMVPDIVEGADGLHWEGEEERSEQLPPPPAEIFLDDSHFSSPEAE